MSRLLRYRRQIAVAAHLLMAIASNYAAFLLRFDFEMPPVHVQPFLRTLPVLLAARGVAFWGFGLYQGLWRYASLSDLQRILGAVALSSGVMILWIVGPFAWLPYPRSVFIIDSLILVCLLGGTRMARRAYREFSRLESEKTVLIYGAGDAGELIVRDMKNNRFYLSDPIGFIDDDRAKVGRSIHGVRVLGTREDLGRLLDLHRPDEVLVAMPSAAPHQVRAIVRSLEHFKVPIKTLPNLRDVLAGRVEVGQIRSLSPEDLMSREPVRLDPEPVRRLIAGRRVLVTGAGGSIGSELVRQLARFGPSRILMLDRYENTLFDIANDLAAGHAGSAHESIVADVTDARRIERVFEAHRPDVVFHAAAHKHVPLMEANPSEAVKNNVRGTRIVAEAAARWSAGEFVLISSDKAVNPSSVMGTSKRVCEQVVRSLKGASRTRFVAVRFGNVLGSNGSVSRVFAEQIRRGGPVTVTHPDVRRYFMLIPEAVQLVLHAAAMTGEDCVYALDMGEQIRIQDFARNLIRLSGFVPDQEIAVRFIGLRPGEKLYEELAEETEHVEPSEIAKVVRVQAGTPMAPDFAARLHALETAGADGRDEEVLRLLADLVPTFRSPQNMASLA
ncbi:MAG: polysaccharide biosynthesis protein [Acidobacteria bacterium]|nr:polysaccharide biosynthesis protein [Acidobacteriota bacterium]